MYINSFQFLFTEKFLNVALGKFRSVYAAVGSGVAQGTNTSYPSFMFRIRNLCAGSLTSLIHLYANISKMQRCVKTFKQRHIFEADIL